MPERRVKYLMHKLKSGKVIAFTVTRSCSCAIVDVHLTIPAVSVSSSWYAALVFLLILNGLTCLCLVISTGLFIVTHFVHGNQKNSFCYNKKWQNCSFLPFLIFFSFFLHLQYGAGWIVTSQLSISLSPFNFPCGTEICNHDIIL